MRTRELCTVAFAWTLLSGCIVAPLRPLQPPPHELDDWKDLDTGTSIQLDRQCDMDVAYQFYGTRNFNYIQVFVHNHLGVARRIELGEVKLTLADGKERIPGNAGYHTDIGAHKKVGFGLLLPQKEDLLNLDQIRVTLPVYDGDNNEDAEEIDEQQESKDGSSTDLSVQDDHLGNDVGEEAEKEQKPSCIIDSTLKRDTRVPHSIATSSNRTHFWFALELGAPIARTTNLTNMGSVAPVIGATFYYHGVHHGMFLGVTIEGFGDGNSAALGVPGQSVMVDQGFVAAGYSYRGFLGKRFNMILDLGPGLYIPEYQFKGSTTYVNTVAFTFVQRAGIDWRIPGPLGEVGLGLGIYNAWIPNGTLGSAPISGDSTGMFGRISVGF